MAPTHIKAGDTVYSADGGVAIYVAHARGGGHIVQPLIEDGDGFSEPESHYVDGVEIWPNCHRKPPQPKLDAEIRAQTEKLAALRREIYEAECTKREAQRDGAALLDARDCRTCRNFTTRSGGCVSVLRCVDGSSYQRQGRFQYWEAAPLDQAPF